MTIKKRIDVSDIEREKYISKGGDVSSDKLEVRFRNIQLRVPVEMLNRIHVTTKKRPWLTRTSWILDAMEGKLKEENL